MIYTYGKLLPAIHRLSEQHHVIGKSYSWQAHECKVYVAQSVSSNHCT